MTIDIPEYIQRFAHRSGTGKIQSQQSIKIKKLNCTSWLCKPLYPSSVRLRNLIVAETEFSHQVNRNKIDS